MHSLYTKYKCSYYAINLILYVLVKAPCECTTGIIERGLRSRDDNARGAAECVIDSRDRKPRSIIPVVYERERCFNWFVARFEPVKQEKARGNDGLRTAVHARILQRAVMDAAADALAESLGAVASELLLATENAADDPNFSISININSGLTYFLLSTLLVLTPVMAVSVRVSERTTQGSR